MKPLLLICQHSPWADTGAREALDIALAGGAFDLPVRMLWRGDGVWQLNAGQNPALLEQKNLQAQLQSLPLFGVDELYVCAASLASRALEPAQLVLPAQPLDRQQLQQLLGQSQQVLVF